MKHRSAAGLAGLVLTLLLAAPAAAAAPANVNVRAEGLSGTVLPKTSVTTTTAPVNKDGMPGHDCTGTSAAGALEQATRGDWAADWFGSAGYFADRILGESSNPSSTFWYFWINYRPSDAGLCGVELQPGDDVLLYIDCFAGCASRMPLRLSRVPATAAPGTTAAVLVETFTGAAAPVAAPDATVRVGSREFKTDGNGLAHVTFEGAGPVSLRATKDGTVPSATEQTCVTTGSDGVCGTVRPSPPDTTAPEARIVGIRDGQVFSRRRAPRELRGTVAGDPSGLWAVKIRLSRRFKGDCWYFSGSREQFLERTCGKKHAFKVGEAGEWSYLLPARLPRGRYWLDLYAIDRAFNKTAFTRGTNRVSFTVR